MSQQDAQGTAGDGSGSRSNAEAAGSLSLTMSRPDAAITAAFIEACGVDVAVRKPGNVSIESDGHGMQAEHFLAAAHAAAPHLVDRRLALGERIEAAVRASWDAAGCNTNLGIILLCAPIALAAQRGGDEDDASEPRDRAGPADAAGLRAWRANLARAYIDADVADAQAAFRAIAHANPGGLGRADAHDVNAPAAVSLHAAMASAADRDRIAQTWRDGGAPLWDVGLAALSDPVAGPATDAATRRLVQRIFLAWMASGPDSHIVRKHGEALAHSVMAEAVRWQRRALAGEDVGVSPEWIAWDADLKARRINPGTCADFTVATWMLARLAQPQRLPSPRSAPAAAPRHP